MQSSQQWRIRGCLAMHQRRALSSQDFPPGARAYKRPVSDIASRDGSASAFNCTAPCIPLPKMPTEPLEYAQHFVDFLNEAPTPYHAVAYAKKQLSESGFVELKEKDGWEDKVKKNGKYFVTRNTSSLIAFSVGDAYTNGNGVAIVGAHTDSPCLRIKPISKKNKEGFMQVGVEVYGGMLAHTWFDRDLSVAGRVYVKRDGQLVPKLVNLHRPLLRIPTLAIHFDRLANQKFEFNKEEKLVPIAGQVAHDKHEVEETKKKPTSCADDPALQMSSEQFESVQSVVQRHNNTLLELIATDLDAKVEDIEDFELVLYDYQASTLGGLNNEFIFSGRLDNLTSCYCAVQAIVQSKPSDHIQMISLFDHEEIGSVSAQGAQSSFLPDVLDRISGIDFIGESSFKTFLPQLRSNSFLLSSDMAHGIHPNYTLNYEEKNKPQVNGGPVIKINANQRYATNSAGIVMLKQIANKAKVPLQLFVVRNDHPCGSTIGPLLSAKLGMRTLDLGNPQLSMHSIRETGGSFDIKKLVDLFRGFFETYTEVSQLTVVD